MRKLTGCLIASLIVVLFCFSQHAQTTSTGQIKIDLRDFEIASVGNSFLILSLLALICFGLTALYIHKIKYD